MELPKSTLVVGEYVLPENETCTSGGEIPGSGNGSCTSGNEVCTSGNTLNGTYVLAEVYRTSKIGRASCRERV